MEEKTPARFLISPHWILQLKLPTDFSRFLFLSFFFIKKYTLFESYSWKKQLKCLPIIMIYNYNFIYQWQFNSIFMLHLIVKTDFMDTISMTDNFAWIWWKCYFDTAFFLRFLRNDPFFSAIQERDFFPDILSFFYGEILHTIRIVHSSNRQILCISFKWYLSSLEDTSNIFIFFFFYFFLPICSSNCV